MSGAECKEKWRNIRNVFVRNLKPCKKGSRERRKPYYLNEVMQFTIPYIKWSKVTIDGKPVTSMDTQASNTEDSDDEDIALHATSSRQLSADNQPLSELCNNRAASPQSYPEPTASPQPQSSLPAFLQSRPEPTQSPQSPLSLPSPSDLSSSLYKDKGRKTKSSPEDGFIEYLKTKQARIEINQDLEQQPKKMFLLSLLPDLENMSDRQMRMFKTRVMRLIENILDDSLLPATATDTAAANNSQVPVYYETRVKIEKADDDNFDTEN
ncbi:hypothetical protein ACJJTC_009013 [Scirpophaga incertulas]